MNRNNLIDRPLTGTEKWDEPLGLSSYAEALGGFICKCETPLTIGIQGDWGIGKTSLLNLLIRDLCPKTGRNQDYPTFYINTWQYAQFGNEEYLGISVLNAIIDKIHAQADTDEKLVRKLKSFGNKAFRFVSQVTNQAVRKNTGINVLEAASSASDPTDGFTEMADLATEYKATFAQLAEQVIPQDDGSKMVIMLDDLDRVRPSRALELLESIKIFLDVPKCVFVLAIDYSVIQQGVRDKLGENSESFYGKSYFDKIIQVPFNMPTCAYQMDAYVMSLLGWEPLPDSDSYRRADDYNPESSFIAIKNHTLALDDVDFFTNIVKATIGPNPRSIKRVVNYASLLKQIYQMNRQPGEVFSLKKAKILFALACLHLEWPEIFGYFANTPSVQAIKNLESWTFLSQLPVAQPLFQRTSNEQQLKTDITTFFDELLDLIDENQNGEISANELEPIWTMMVLTNLTSARLQDNQGAWNDFASRAEKLVQPDSKHDFQTVQLVMKLFRESSWNDPLQFKLYEAGKRFYNLIWKGQQIGSLVTTRQDPIQLYLTVPKTSFDQQSALTTIIERCTHRHYGAGETSVNISNLKALNDFASQLTAFNEINAVVRAWADNNS